MNAFKKIRNWFGTGVVLCVFYAKFGFEIAKLFFLVAKDTGKYTFKIEDEEIRKILIDLHVNVRCDDFQRKVDADYEKTINQLIRFV